MTIKECVLDLQDMDDIKENLLSRYGSGISYIYWQTFNDISYGENLVFKLHFCYDNSDKDTPYGIYFYLGDRQLNICSNFNKIKTKLSVSELKELTHQKLWELIREEL